jgi:hypothetical protein
MQTQTQKTGELFGESKAKVTTTTVKEITPLGVRYEVNYGGQFAGSLYSARELGTITAFLKADGTMEWEVKEIASTAEGDVILASGRGTGKLTGPGMFWSEGEGVVMTQSKRLSSLNGMKLRVEGTSNQATGELQSKFFTL